MAGFSYRRLFNTQITHEYYVSGISKKDLAITPTTGAVQLMKNAGMLYRNDESGFRVMYKANDDATPFVNYSNVRLVFAMQLLNITEFLNFTDLKDNDDRQYTAGRILYFTNKHDLAGPSLNYALIDYLRPAMFTYEFPQWDGSGTVGSIRIYNDDGNNVTPAYPDPDNILPDDNNHFYYPIDFSKMPKGLYHFQTETDTAPMEERTIYIDTELASQNVFGIIDIVVQDAGDGSFPIPDDEFIFHTDFKFRKTFWKYFVVLKSPNNAINDDLYIQDTTSAEPYGEMKFDRRTDENTVVNGYDTAVFLAQKITPFYELPKIGLNFLNADVPVFNNLSNPAIGVVSADPTDFGITQIFVTI